MRVLGSDWPDGHVAKLRQLWDAGLSASEIARELDGVYSRSAILGKSSRLKLAPRRSDNARAPMNFAVPPARPRGPKQAPAFEPKQRRNPSHDIIEQLKINASEPGLSKNLEEPSDGKGVKLIDLERHHCRWPKGDPRSEDFMFCGETAVEGRPYCAFHTLKSIDRSSTVRSASRSKDFEKSALSAAR